MNRDNGCGRRREIENLNLEEIIDVGALQSLMDDFYTLAHFPACVINANGKVLAGVGWQDICSKFHRTHPETLRHCLESDTQLAAGITSGEFRLYKCKNHMWDIATPIIVEGQQIGSVFSGQFFFDDERPDYDLFLMQAANYGFNETEYLAALGKVPRFSREFVNTGMAFLVKLAHMISILSYSNITLTHSLRERERAEEALRLGREKERFLADIVSKAELPLAIGYPDGRLGIVNPAFCKLTGYDEVELGNISWNTVLTPPEWIETEMRMLAELDSTGKPVRYRKEYIRKDGKRVPVELFVQLSRNEIEKTRHYYAFVTDITERQTAEEQLRQLSDRLLLATRAASVGIWDLDIGTDTLLWDDAMHRLYGIPPELFTGTSQAWRSAIHPDDLERALNEVEMAMRGEKEFDTEFRVLRPDRSVRYIKAIGLVQRDASGRAVRMLGTNWDITERKKAENALLESEHRYRSLFENIHEGFAYCRMFFDEDRPSDFVYLNVNPAFEKLTGLRDVVGKKVSEVIPGIRESNPELFEVYGRVALTRRPERFETYIGALGIWFSVSVYSPEKGFFVSVFDNITERKRIEEALRNSEEIYRSVMDNVGIGIALINRDMEILALNSRMRSLFPDIDITTRPICYRSFNNPPRQTICPYCPTHKTLQDGLVHEAITATPAGGEIRHYRVVSSPIRDNEGNIVSAVEMVEDITEHRKLEEQFYQAQKMEAVGELAGGIAHDFNNILTAIVGYGHILKMKLGDSSPLSNYAEHILSLSDKAAKLTQNLLAFSRKQIINPRPIELNETIRKTTSLLSKIVPEDIDLIMALFEEDLTVLADPVQIEQTLLNLAANARDAMPRGGSLTIETHMVSLDRAFIIEHGYGKEGPYALISVTDTGSGMDKKTQDKIFNPFFTTKEVGKGTGLGLAMVYGIIKQHEGYINVYSEPGMGTVFRIYLPLIDVKVEDTRPEATPLVRGGTETVLLVEDETELRIFLKHLLEEHGYRVLEAEDGHDAIRVVSLHKDEIQLLLSDIVMPGMNGRDAYEKISQVIPGIKSIFMSGYSSDIVHRKGIIEEGLDIVAKPVSPAVLLKKVREALDKCNQGDC